MVEGNNRGFSKTCYYELLDVDRKAETKDIMKVTKFAVILFLTFLYTGLQTSCVEVASGQEQRQGHYGAVLADPRGIRLPVEQPGKSLV